MPKKKPIKFTGIIHTDCLLKKNTKFGWVTIPLLLDLERKGLLSKRFKKVEITVKFIEDTSNA